MMSKNKKRPYKPGVPSTKSKPKGLEISFNLAQVVHNYAVCKRLIALFEQTVNEEGHMLFPESTAFYSGLIRGYDDWFDSLRIDQERFDAAFEKLDKQNIIGDADAQYARVVDAKLKKAKESQRRVIMPGDDITKQDIKVAKEIFGQKFSKIEEKG